MMFGVPQFINIEDKIVGPLTGKQLLWIAAMCATLFLLWTILSKVVFFIVGVPVALFFIALAFLKPNGQSFLSFIVYVGYYMFSSKEYVWKKEVVRTRKKENEPKKTNQQKIKKQKLNFDEIKQLTQVLDSKNKK